MSFAQTEMEVVRYAESSGVLKSNIELHVTDLSEQVINLYRSIHYQNIDLSIEAIGKIIVILTYISVILDIDMSGCYEEEANKLGGKNE